MITRTRNTLVVFHHPFELRGVDRTLPAREYRVMTDEQLIEELSFLVYRRVSTVIFAPGQSPNSSSVEIGPAPWWVTGPTIACPPEWT
jgi:hypothetical protein